MEKNTSTEVVIVGGSFAGLSAAMALGRALRNVLVIDSGKPCNATSPHTHNLITHDGEKPSVISAKAKKEVMTYPTVSFLEDEVIDVSGTNNDFTVITSGGKNISCKKILFATGIRDIIPPEIEGFDECWGVSVLHCPYCHGYEVKKKKTAVMANGEMAFHFCMVLTQWTDEIILFTHGDSTMEAGQVEKLVQHNVMIIENKIQSIEHRKGYLKTLHLENGETHVVEVMYAKLEIEQHCNIPVRMGCEVNEMGLLKHDELKKTCVPGIYAAGDNASGRSLSAAIASGSLAGAAINGELTADLR